MAVGQKSVVITGAGAGIGRATAERFARAGWAVGAFDRDIAAVTTLAAEFPDGVIVPGELDVADADAWAVQLEKFTAQHDGSLNVLINNAGILLTGSFADLPLAGQRAIIEVNVNGVINGCHAAHRYLAGTAGAQVVNLCSASAIYGQPGLAVYSSSKFAVRGLSEALDLEWAADGIRVTAMWPLFVQTAMVSGMGDLASFNKIGASLTAEDVAGDILAAVSNPGKSVRGPHRPVGRKAKALFALAAISPNAINRLVNKKMSD